jgi:hypothetical protein
MLGLAGTTWALILASAVAVGGAAALVFFMTRGWLTLDLGWGRSHHRVGPVELEIAAPRDVVFDQIASPYLGRTPADLRSKLEVLERDGNLVLARHRSKLRLLTSVTLETIRFEPPDRVTFRHVRGPVPHVLEEFRLEETASGTLLRYEGDLGIDFWFLGRLAGRYWVVRNWERVVRESLARLKDGAEDRARARRRRDDRSRRGPAR